MKYAHVLLSSLNAKQQEAVFAAISAGIPVIVDGDRSRPTGKSTLCDYLKSLGADACEAWGLEEGSKKKPDSDAKENTVTVVIRLNRDLFT